ncbi:MAG TPA: PilZ domain-containing protein [Candidatus Binatia bacterium]|nr:PilZ domain-containing protein [Candidatus Binatia bacterium]
MSARKVANPELFQPLTVHAQTTRLDLPARAVRIRRNGIEFRADTPIPVWTEMTVAMQTPSDSRKVNFTGVVVACHGDRHTGYMVSLLFTSVSKQAQARLNSMAVAP